VANETGDLLSYLQRYIPRSDAEALDVDAVISLVDDGSRSIRAWLRN
jgi:hypothetical protein